MTRNVRGSPPHSLPPPPFLSATFRPRAHVYVLKLYSARTPDVVSQLVPHLSLLTMCILSTRYIAICQVRFVVRAQFRALNRAASAIFRPAMTTRVRDLSWTDVCQANNK